MRRAPPVEWIEGTVVVATAESVALNLLRKSGHLTDEQYSALVQVRTWEDTIAVADVQMRYVATMPTARRETAAVLAYAKRYGLSDAEVVRLLLLPAEDAEVQRICVEVELLGGVG
jgi:hypothetical protein